MQQALEGLFAELVLGPALSQAELLELTRKHGVDPADADALCASFDRLLVYRELVQSTLREAVQLSIPRSMARLGAVFDEYLARFLVERAPRKHSLREVAPELLEFRGGKLWPNDRPGLGVTIDEKQLTFVEEMTQGAPGPTYLRPDGSPTHW